MSTTGGPTPSLQPNHPVPAAGVGGGGGASTTLERRCENVDCNVGKLLSMVAKRKTSQFITEPLIMDKPLLINGFTTIFQVDGQAAKLSDIKNSDQQQPIYRIVPNTHAHIVNYVVVDGDAEAFKKINDNDPATMKKLLDSQNHSAKQMLKKLMSGQSAPVPLNPTAATTATVAKSIITKGDMLRNPSGISAGATTPPHSLNIANIGGIRITSRSNPTATMKGSASASTTGPSLTLQGPSVNPNVPGVQIPLRIHPNLKITAVSSLESAASALASSLNKSNLSAASASSHNTQVPIISPVPLSTLQRPTPTLQQKPANTSTPLTISSVSSYTSGAAPGSILPIGGFGGPVQGITTDITEKPQIAQLQAEVQELRRTIAQLAQNKQTAQQMASKSAGVPKRK